MDLGIENKVALVTAASRGLGRAAAIGLAREGAQIVLNSRGNNLQEVATEIQEMTGRDVLALRGDLTQKTDIQALVERTIEEKGRIDILFVNAGGTKPGGFMDLEPADWQEAIDLTVMSAVNLCYAVVPHMIARGEGVIITTQSYTAKEPMPNLVLSNSLRMGVVGMMSSLADELGPKGIRVHTINPFFTRTERVEELLIDRAQRNNTTVDEEVEKIVSQVPLGRMGDLEEYGRTVAWLASPMATPLHGHALLFDGGAVKAAI